MRSGCAAGVVISNVKDGPLVRQAKRRDASVETQNETKLIRTLIRSLN